METKEESIAPVQREIAGFEFKIFSKMFICSIIGIFSFFISFQWNGNSTILLDHFVSFIIEYLPTGVNTYVLLLLIFGASYPFITKKWKESYISIVLSFFKVIGLVVGVMLMFDFGPAFLFNADIGPFLLEKLIKPVGIIIPIGAVFLALLVSYGLLDFIGVFMQPVMRPIFKSPGRSAVDAVASFVGSYSVGLMLTNRMYKLGKYTGREAAIVGTGFSTVSAAFMIVVAKTLGLMEHWNKFFWVALVVTFTVTALTARIYPLSRIKDDYHKDSVPQPEIIVRKNRLKIAWTEAVMATKANPYFLKNLFIHLKDGIIMAMGVIPSILSIGLLGLVLANYTPLFDWIAYLFLPFTYILQIPEPLLTAKAVSLSIAEMFLPALLVVKSAIVTKFIVAVVSISAILFFSAVIPVILATEIPLTIRQMLIIWFERVVLTLILVTPIAFLLF